MNGGGRPLLPAWFVSLCEIVTAILNHL